MRLSAIQEEMGEIDETADGGVKIERETREENDEKREMGI